MGCVLTITRYVSLIRTRTGEGRARARLRGQHMGRPPKMTAAQKQEARRGKRDRESVAYLARPYSQPRRNLPNDGLTLRAAH